MSQSNYSDLKEKANHGDYMLPFAKYRTRIPINFSSYPMHWHDEIEVIYVKEGRYQVNIDLQQYTVEAGSILVISPGVLHAFKQLEDYNMTSFTFLFHARMIESLVPDVCMVNYINPFLNGKYTFSPIITPDTDGYEYIQKAVEFVLDTYDSKEEFFELRIKAGIYNLFFELFKYVFKVTENEYVSKYDISDNIKTVIDYIHTNYMDTIAVTQLAELLNFSEAHFMRYFKKHVGVTCVEYINDFRVNKAANLLAATNQSVGEIADAIGVSNVSYFNRMFKKAFGVAPIEYRKNAAKKVQ